MDCVRDWNCLSTMLSSEKYYGIISILHLAGRLWLWASTTQVRVDTLFDDAWCIWEKNTNFNTDWRLYTILLRTLYHIYFTILYYFIQISYISQIAYTVWDFSETFCAEALTRGWKVLWMMHGTCTPCWGEVYSVEVWEVWEVWNGEMLSVYSVYSLKFLKLRFVKIRFVQRFTGRDLVLEGSLCHWMMTESDSWLTATRATRCRLHRWDESSMNSMFSAMQYFADTFYILLIWFLQDFCAQVPSRDNILMNLQWSNAQCTWLDHAIRVYFVDLVDLYFVYDVEANCIFGWKLCRCEAMGPKLGRINTLWTQGAQPQALPTPCSCSSVTLWMPWTKNFPLMSIEPQSHLVRLMSDSNFFFGNVNL